MSQVKYIKCPRCELNYIPKNQKLCTVCQEELKANRNQAGQKSEDLENEMLCPICKSNYISEDEEICSICAREQELNEEKNGTDNEADNWRMYVDNDDEETLQDEIGDMSSITDLDEEGDILNDDLDLNLDDDDDDEDDEDEDDEDDDEDDEDDDEDDDDDLDDLDDDDDDDDEDDDDEDDDD